MAREIYCCCTLALSICNTRDRHQKCKDGNFDAILTDVAYVKILINVMNLQQNF